MKKKREKVSIRGRNRLQKMLMVMKLTFFLTVFMVGTLHASVNAQLRLTMNLGEANLKEVFDEIQRQTSKTVIYNNERLDLGRMIKADFNDMELDAVLDEVLSGSGMGYKFVNDYIVIVPQKEEKENFTSQTVKEKTIKGVVKDEEGSLLPGVTVLIKGTTIGTATDVNGAFSLNIPDMKDIVLLFSFVGMKTQEINVKGKTTVDVVMEEEQTEMDEVVVTGIYTRKKESFTGSLQTYSREELKMVGTQNLLQSLKTLDPAFHIVENNQFGSDPNRTPDIEIRGKTSIVGMKEQFGEDPNQPLFILDGFETTLETIMDLSMDRVASVTILKDAASTAIYGSKAANGVVVVETRAPERGRIQLSYNGSFEISFADLTEYNLMNAAEKLEFERLSGRFNSNLVATEEEYQMRYYKLLANVQRGVDTYWMSEPLRTALTQKHNVYVEGGDTQMRYGLGLSYTNIDGVMKESRRQVMSGNLDLLYRKNKLSFSNKLSVDYTKTNDPIVPFSEYALANPYYPKYAEGGGIEKWLESPDDTETNLVQGTDIWVGNPLWNASLNSYQRGNTFSVRDNFQLEWRPYDFLYVRARFGITKSTSDNENFTSPEDTSFDETEDEEKGDYSDTRQESLSYDGDATITYGQLLGGVHQINAVLGANLSETTSEMKSFSAVGFPEGDFTKPSFASQYPSNSKPSYSDSKKRAVSFYFNGGYSYDNRYLLDVNFRSDGSSVFGTNRRFTTTWAVGLAWNLHNEKFVAENTNLFSMLKIRASVGNPGNQNFGSYNTITTYEFNNWSQNQFGASILVDAFGDPDLDWQKTLDKNVGFDLSMFDNRFHVNFDYYHKRTDPLIASIGVPLSVGVSSRLTNVGVQISQGLNATVKYSFLYKPEERINWTTSLTFSRNHSEYDEIGNSLNALNAENRTKSLSRFYSGGSPSDLWAVRSLGIDPATGREIFLGIDGFPTFTHSYNDEVVVGNSEPTLEGVFGNTLYYKGFSCNVYIRYSFGADAFNSTVYNKVENISEADLTSNQDKRALYDRWKNPGDISQYKGISLTETTPMSSRFVQKNNFIVLESIRIGYEFAGKWMDQAGISGMTFSAYMNDIARFASIKDERGIDYPFARSFSFALSVNF